MHKKTMIMMIRIAKNKLWFMMAIIFVCSCTLHSFSQKKKKIKDESQKEISFGRLFGRLETNNAPLPFASISLYKPKAIDKAMAGTVADENGLFEFNDVQYGSYVVVIQAVSIEKWTSEKIILETEELNLGLIALSQASKTLDEVLIKEQKNEIELSLDKKIFNANSNLTAVGGTAIDLLRNIPSVFVNPDGEIQIRGSNNILVLIDGRPSGITTSNRQSALELLPANSIEKVEIISNPSSKYQADGTAGIINLITKKSQNLGYSLRGNAMVGNRNKYNGLLSANFHRKKFNAYIDFSFRDFYRLNKQTLERDQFTKNGNSRINQSASEINRDNNQNIKLGFDVFATKRATISAFALLRKGNDRNDEERYSNTTYLENNSLPRLYLRKNHKIGTDLGLDVYAGFRKLFDKPSRLLTIDFTHIGNTLADDNDYNQSYFYQSFANPSRDIPERFEQARNKNINKSYILQSDFTEPLPNNAKIEVGIRSAFRTVENNFTYFRLDNYTNIYNIDKKRSNSFNYDETVHAGYINYIKSYKKWNGQIGIRAENTVTKAKQITTEKINNRNYINLFPSFFLNNQITDNQQLQLLFSKRINRPSYKSLNPFINQNDPLNLSTGNANLLPELVNSIEISHVIYTKKTTINTSLFYKYIENSVARVRQLINGDTTLATFLNLGHSTNMGVEMVISKRFDKWLRINTNLSAFKSEIIGQTTTGDFQRQLFSILGRLNMQIMPSKVFTLQFSQNYSSPTITPQGKVSNIYTSDFGAKYELFKGRASVNLKINDVFNTQQQTIYTEGLGFNAINFKKNETRYGMIGITYRIAKQLKAEKSQRERKKVNEERVGDDEN